MPLEIILANKTEASGTLLRSLPGGSVERRELTGKDGGAIEFFDEVSLAKLSYGDRETLKRILTTMASADAAESC
jgi:hypothetical protein